MTDDKPESSADIRQVLGLARQGRSRRRAIGWIVALVAISFSAAVGVIFGFFPARKAARMNPIDALRHE